MRLAIVADPHVHDPGFDPRGDGSGAWRTLEDTVGSTRVFNESLAAFREVLARIAARGIRHVVIVGDMTDDGELYARRAFLRLVEEFGARCGMRFFTTFGNHDLFALEGRHMAKRFARPGGGSDLVGSGRKAQIVHPGMFCPGYAETIASYAALGFMRQPADLHWETPFGPDDAPAARRYEVASQDGAQRAEMLDGSYLVEPVAGLWLLSIDANAYWPEGKSFVDGSETGWGATLRYKPFLLDWIGNVTARAARLGKQLVAFSHYPMAGPFPGDARDEAALFAASRNARRTVAPAVTEALAATGLGVHFSGHWHVGGIAGRSGITNISVPSLVAFPSAYMELEIGPDGTTLDTIAVTEAPGFEAARAAYGESGDAVLLAGATDYADFLDRHLALLVESRYLPREWPAALTTRDVAGVPFLQFADDWYRLRKGGALGRARIDPARLAAYRALSRDLAGTAPEPGSPEAILAAALRLMEASLAAPDLRRQRLDLRGGGAVISGADAAAPSGAIPVPAGT